MRHSAGLDDVPPFDSDRLFDLEAGLRVYISPKTNGLYDANIVLDTPLLYVSEACSNQQCRVALVVTESQKHTNSYFVKFSSVIDKTLSFNRNRRSSGNRTFDIPKPFMNEPVGGMARTTAYEDSFNVYVALGRKQPTDAGYLYLFVFPPYSGFTSEDTVALFKSPETFPYDEFDGVLIRARLNLMGNADQ